MLGAGSVAVSGSLEDIAAHAGIAATTVVQVEATATEGLDTLRGFLGDKAAVLFAPTLVAAIYGMNFDRMPELHWALGYPMAVGIMVVFAAGLYAIFKWKKWM